MISYLIKKLELFSILHRVGLGGTFDHLHKGHRLLLETALNVGYNVVIGLATKDLLENKEYSSKLESFKTRKKNLEEFISTLAELQRVEIIKLNDPYGPPAYEADYQGIIVSEETYETALKINQMRKDKGIDPMIIVVIPLLKDENNKKISSTIIRQQL
ncbi:MAG: pantetheine-phosphate adenylyltransferase [Candidatus Lokiarchaeota archaeon]|nr:pantetheine-phosphate adenylyltransferase [Candidatus Lokiarchaeota archaeon]MBD3202342.1 pantetheine-phosphate adenylyltransferase [Candidatus Lokiarchaeota archaeon]